MAGKFYAVRKGHKPGIYTSSVQYMKQTKGFPHFEARAFSTMEDAQEFMDAGKEESPPQPVVIDRTLTTPFTREPTPRERLQRMAAQIKNVRRIGQCSAKERMQTENDIRRTFCNSCQFSGSCKENCLMDAAYLEAVIQIAALQQEMRDILKKGNLTELIEKADSVAEEKEFLHGRYAVFTDGSSAHGCFGWAFTVYHEGQQIYGASGNGENPNGRDTESEFAETKAVMQAVAWLRSENVSEAVICYDCNQLYGCPDSTKNIALQNYISWMKEHTMGIDLQFLKVKAHSGVTRNEITDWMAKEALWRKIVQPDA